MNRRLKIALGTGLIAVVAMVPVADTRAQTAQTKQVMQQKLTLSQGLLAGLVTSNWGALRTDSHGLGALTRDPGWAVMREPEYVRQTVEFLRSADALAEAADSRDQEGTLSAYNRLVASCVQCHRSVARARIAGRLPTAP